MSVLVSLEVKPGVVLQIREHLSLGGQGRATFRPEAREATSVRIQGEPSLRLSFQSSKIWIHSVNNSVRNFANLLYPF